MNLSAFLAQNALKAENQKLVVSERFVDEKGNPVEWEIRALTEAENDALRKACTKVVTIKRVARTTETDYHLYHAKVVAESVVYPNLKDVSLQESYGAFGAEDLLQKMLTSGEYSKLAEVAQALSGFDMSDEDLVEEAKN